MEPATVALTGAAAMLLVTRQSVEDALRGDRMGDAVLLPRPVRDGGRAWRRPGRSRRSPTASRSLTAGDRTAELLGIAWLSAIGSGVVDNIPFTATMIPVVEQLQGGNAGDNAYWWSLSLGACFGGNATLIAAAANVAAAGMAARAGRPIGFMPFLKSACRSTLFRW